MTKYIAWLTSILVLVVAAMSFALSYHALQGMAAANGLPGWLSYLWPLLIDFALIVFSLCVVTAHLYSESTWRQWSLVGIATISTCVYNYLHAPDTLVAQSIAIVPPVMLFFSFELLMMQLKNSIHRNELTANVAQLSGLIDTYNQRLARVSGMIDDATVQTNIITAQLDTIQQQAQRANDETVSNRRQRVLSLKGEGVTQKQMADMLGVSISTIRSDIVALNGKAK